MQTLLETDSFESFKSKTSHNRRVILMAKTIMDRAKNAGIPDKFLRINQSEFKKLLDTDFHDKEVEKISTYIYKQPLKAIRQEFFVIDGGTILERKKAGFALLFRFIACDRYGLHRNCSELAHQLQSIKSMGYDGPNRTEVTEQLRDIDILFISECSTYDFKRNFETGKFFDEILTYRDDNSKPTIISFSSVLPVSAATETPNNVMKDREQFGQYLCDISQSAMNKDSRFLRIKVDKI